MGKLSEGGRCPRRISAECEMSVSQFIRYNSKKIRHIQHTKIIK